MNSEKTFLLFSHIKHCLNKREEFLSNDLMNTVNIFQSSFCILVKNLDTNHEAPHVSLIFASINKRKSHPSIQKVKKTMKNIFPLNLLKLRKHP